MSARDLNRLLARRLALAALLLSHLFVAGLAGVFGVLFGPGGMFMGDPGTFALIEMCAILVSLLVWIVSLILARCERPIGRWWLAIGMVLLVVIARVLISLLMGSGMARQVLAFSYGISWGVPEIIALVATLLVHRRTYGADA